jgi:hypothetical protein
MWKIERHMQIWEAGQGYQRMLCSDSCCHSTAGVAWWRQRGSHTHAARRCSSTSASASRGCSSSACARRRSEASGQRASSAARPPLERRTTPRSWSSTPNALLLSARPIPGATGGTGACVAAGCCCTASWPAAEQPAVVGQSDECVPLSCVVGLGVAVQSSAVQCCEVK